MRNATIASLLCLALLGAPALAQTAALSGPASVGAGDPKISLSAQRRPAGEVIDSIAAKAGWSVTASGNNLMRIVSVRVKDRPASEVLATVAEVAALETRFGPGNALVVKDASTPAPAPAAAAPPVVAPSAVVAPPPADVVDPVGDDDDDDAIEKVKEKTKHHDRKNHGSDRTVVGEDVEVAADETVRDVVTTGGSITVRGHVTRDAVAVGGSVILEPGARVDRDAVAVGGTVEVKPGATLGRERTAVGGALGKVLSSAARMSGKSGKGHSDHEGRGFFGRLWWTVPFFVLGFLTMLFVPDRLLGLRASLTARPWASTAAGVGSWFGIVALCVILGVTIIGIPLIPLAIVGYFGLGLFGLTALAWWTGTKLSFIPGTDRPLVAFCIGTLVFMLIAAIPVVGTLTLVTATTVSGGAALLLLIQSLRKKSGSPPAAPAEAEAV